MKPLRVALCGNPNVGKSTVFNALTGLKQHTGNWSGKTVDTAVGEVRHNGRTWQLTDLPGAYSLLSGSAEEIVASDHLTLDEPDAVIVVCDAGALERNLNLALQIAQYCPNVVLCINMLDEARRSGITIDVEALEKRLGIPVAGICARRREGLQNLKDRVHQAAACRHRTPASSSLLPLPQPVEDAIQTLTNRFASEATDAEQERSWRLAALRALAGSEFLTPETAKRFKDPKRLQKSVEAAKDSLLHMGYTHEKLISLLMESSYQKAREVCREVVSDSVYPHRLTLHIDRILCRKWAAALLWAVLLGSILYLTIIGANIPSEWLSSQLTRLGFQLERLLTQLCLPAWIIDLLMSGVYRVTSWVVSVMLPPMAIFFPLFTLLEDIGILPRIAFHLDRCFARCHSCGKQALCMCMGLGCNAVGVTGCRIIQSPRERLIAVLTNALIPCNGRFPMLIALISIFFIRETGNARTLAGVLLMMLLLVLSVGMTFLCSKLLSRTLLCEVPSAFAIELPPYRCPKWGEVIVRSIFDRTLFVLGRAVSAAAPAGAVVWLLTKLTIRSTPLIQVLCSALDPIGHLLCMDGAILLAFMLGFPANEIVLPLLMMLYSHSGMLVELQGFEHVRLILTQNGWTLWTAAAVLIFTLFHWPCSTTTLTLFKETRSLKWTAVGFVLPAAAGAVLCLLLHAVQTLAQLL